MSIMVFAGASQIMAVGMFVQGAALPVIVFATFLLNLRHLIMSSYVMNKLKGTKMSMKRILAFALCDESFALFSAGIGMKIVKDAEEKMDMEDYA